MTKSPTRESEGYQYMYLYVRIHIHSIRFMTSALYFLSFFFLLFIVSLLWIDEHRHSVYVCVTNIFDKHTWQDTFFDRHDQWSIRNEREYSSNSIIEFFFFFLSFSFSSSPYINNNPKRRRGEYSFNIAWAHRNLMKWSPKFLLALCKWIHTRLHSF